MFWNSELGFIISPFLKLTVNMKCFEIIYIIIFSKNIFKLTVNMKCFEINFCYLKIFHKYH